MMSNVWIQVFGFVVLFVAWLGIVFLIRKRVIEGRGWEILRSLILAFFAALVISNLDRLWS